VIELGPSQRSLVEALARKEPYPYHISGIRGLESRVFDSLTHEITSSRKVLALRPGCGHMET
jgi:hypothetical protein